MTAFNAYLAGVNTAVAILFLATGNVAEASVYGALAVVLLTMPRGDK